MAKRVIRNIRFFPLCVSDYTSLHDSVRIAQCRAQRPRSSLSFPSQRADRMNLDIAEERKRCAKVVSHWHRKRAPSACAAVIIRVWSHQQIISAIEAAYQIRLGIDQVVLHGAVCPPNATRIWSASSKFSKEATIHCRPSPHRSGAKYRKTSNLPARFPTSCPSRSRLSNGSVGQSGGNDRNIRCSEVRLRDAPFRNVQLNVRSRQISLLESVSRAADRKVAQMIYDAWRSGCTFDAWNDRFRTTCKWHDVAEKHGVTLEELGCTDRGSRLAAALGIVHIGLNTWWMVKEWEKALALQETPPCTENLCHACGSAPSWRLSTALAVAKPEVMKRNPFVKELAANKNDEDHHPSLFFMKPEEEPSDHSVARIRFILKKEGDLRFISHLDLQHLITRAARRAAMNVAYTMVSTRSPK